MLKPSLSTRTKLALYINSIPFEHQRADFSQVLRDQGAYHTLWRIVQLARMAFMTLGDVDRSELWNGDYKSPLKDLIKSLADDSEEGDIYVQCTGGRVTLQFNGATPNFQDLVETLVVSELDRAYRGVERGSPQVIEQFDQAMLELIYEVGLTASAKNRFFNHFLRDVMVLVSPRFNWMAEYVSKPAAIPTRASFNESTASSTSAYLPDWITADKGVHQVLPEFQIDATTFDESVQTTWNDQAPINQLIFLIRQALGSKDDNRTQNCFTTLVGSLDQFTTLLLAQAMVKRDLPQTQAPEASEAAQEAPVIKGTEPGAQGDIQRALSDMTWRFEEVDPVEGDRLGDPLPESWSKAAEIIRAALRKSARRATSNGTSALDLNGMIERSIIALIGPAPSKGIFSQDQQSPPHHPMLRRSEEVSDPAGDQLRNIEKQRYEQRLTELTTAIKELTVYYGETEAATAGVVAFVLRIGESAFKTLSIEELATAYADETFRDADARRTAALGRLSQEVKGFDETSVRYAVKTAVRSSTEYHLGDALEERLKNDMEDHLAKATTKTQAEDINLLPLARKLMPAAVAAVVKVRSDLPAGEDMGPETVSNTFLFESLPQAVREFFNALGQSSMTHVAGGGRIELSKKGDFFECLASMYHDGDFYQAAVGHVPEALEYIDRCIAEVMGAKRTTFDPASFREQLLRYLVVEHYSLMDGTFVRDHEDLEKGIWYFMNFTKDYVHAVREKAVCDHLLFGEVVPDWNTTPVGNDRHGVVVWAKSVAETFYGSEDVRIAAAWAKFKNAMMQCGFHIRAEIDRVMEIEPRGAATATAIENTFKIAVILRYGPADSLRFTGKQEEDFNLLDSQLRDVRWRLEQDLVTK